MPRFTCGIGAAEKRPCTDDFSIGALLAPFRSAARTRSGTALGHIDWV
jgi:hypothetical protein